MQRSVATKISSFATTSVAAGLFAVALQRHTLAFEGTFGDLTLDQLVLWLLLPAIIFAALFVGGHLLLRGRKMEARLSYSLLGAVALLTSTGITTPLEVYNSAIGQGFLSLLCVLTAGLGSLLGFIYVRSAGFEFDEDESQAVGNAQRLRDVQANVAQTFGSVQANQSSLAGAALHGGQTNDQDASVLTTANDEFFDGPLRVVTSTRALFLSALAAAVAHTFYSFFVVTIFGAMEGRGRELLMEQAANGELATSFGAGIVFSLLICLLIVTPSVFGLHKLLQSRKTTEMSSYIVWGALAPIGAGLAMFVIGILFTHWFVLPMAVAMGTYRHLAGLEPDVLPEDILVRDRRTLVGKDHARRRVHRVIG